MFIHVCSGTSAFIGGGSDNNVAGSYAIVVGGERNTVSAEHSAILGGQYNKAAATYVPCRLVLSLNSAQCHRCVCGEE